MSKLSRVATGETTIALASTRCGLVERNRYSRLWAYS